MEQECAIQMSPQHSQPIKYYGLFNQGATCYLNSVLQVLYMTEGFKSAVERYSRENPDSDDYIDLDLEALFKDLRNQTATTDTITCKLRIDRVGEQRDAAEYFEKILNLTSPEASKIFHGVLTHRSLCLSCRTPVEVDSPFWHLTLALANFNENNYGVLDGLNQHFQAVNLSGDDQIYCDYCCAKSDFTVGYVMKQHPDVLLLLIKRFAFDYNSMTYVKKDCNFDVPFSLRIPTTNQTYDLHSVVYHMGDHRNGHYTAVIKCGEDWYLFDDTRVTLKNGEKFQVDTRKAYLLFYKKRNDWEEKSQGPPSPPADSNVYHQCGDAGGKREREEVEGAAVVGHEVEGPGPEDFDSGGSAEVGSLNEKNEIPHAQATADVYGLCADLEPSEKEKEKTEPEEGGGNGAHSPTTSNHEDRNIFIEPVNTKTPRPKRRGTLAANLGRYHHQTGSTAGNYREIIDRKLSKKYPNLIVKIIEEEYRPLHMHPSIHPSLSATCSSTEGREGTGAYPSTLGQSQGPPWTGRQSVTGLIYIDKQPFTLTLTITPRDNLEFSIDLIPNRASLLTVGGSQSTRREPTQTQGEHANSTQKEPSFHPNEDSNPE